MTAATGEPRIPLDDGSLPNAALTHPELRAISAGDVMARTPKAVEYIFVAEIDAGRALVL